MDCGNLISEAGSILWRYDMNGRSQMQGGKNSILPKKQTGSSGTLIGLKSGKHSFPSIGPNGGTVAMDSGFKGTQD
jgi:hypothetical protein